jgi:lysozyme family protein
VIDAEARFAACVAEVLRQEGGYIDHPADPGGCTNRGITRATLVIWRRQPVTCAEVATLGEAEARAIYRAHYWNAVRGDDLPPGLDLVVLDAAVNSGRRRSVSWLQQAVGVEPDGAIGPRTLAAVRAVNDHRALLRRLCALRLDFLRGLPAWPEFGRGWQRRVDAVRDRALTLEARP